MLVYILQSFRSLNLILLMNLPVLTMLNKSARQLIHFNFITSGIDYDKKIARVKPMFHQLNQHTGKSYWKYPRVKVNGKLIVLERLRFSLPPDYLIEPYEKKKAKYVNSLTDDYVAEMDNIEKQNQIKMARKELTDTELEVFEDIKNGLSIAECSEKRGRGERSTYEALARAKKKGYSINEQK